MLLLIYLVIAIVVCYRYCSLLLLMSNASCTLLLLGVNIENSNAIASVREVNTLICQLPGFVSLQWLLESHCSVAEIYYLLGCLLVNQQVSLPAGTVQVSS